MKTVLDLLCLLAFGALMLAACASTPQQISSAPPTAEVRITTPSIVKDFQSAAYNLDTAQAIGALAKDDPAPACWHSVLQKHGIESVPGAAAVQSFTPKSDGAASDGATLYILAQQAKAALGTGLTVAPSCEAVVGRFFIDGLAAAVKALPLPGIVQILKR